MNKPKVGGRVKGTMNRKSESLFELCEEMGFNPFAELMRLAFSTDDEAVRASCLKELCQYLYPKRKAVELSMDPDSAFKVIIEDYGVKK